MADTRFGRHAFTIAQLNQSMPHNVVVRQDKLSCCRSCLNNQTDDGLLLGLSSTEDASKPGVSRSNTPQTCHTHRTTDNVDSDDTFNNYDFRLSGKADACFTVHNFENVTVHLCITMTIVS